MRTLLNQLRVRLILGALLFLLGLTGAVILVVRDSLQFSARNMEQLGAQGLVEQAGNYLLEIVKREAELSDHAIHHNLNDLSPLIQRLDRLNLTPNAYAFVMDENGRLVAISQGKAANLFEGGSDTESSGRSLSEIDNQDLRALLREMQAGQSDSLQISLGDDNVLIAYAPLTESRWSLAIVAPLDEITASAGSLSRNIDKSVNDILKATLLTIGYFAVLAIVGVIFAARALTSPIQKLVEGTRAIAAGDLHARIPVSSSDELGVLADSFNQMSEELLTRNTEISEREAHLRLITEVTTDAIYDWDIPAGKTVWNDGYRALFGYTVEGVHEHQWWRERIHPEDLERIITRLEGALRNQEEYLSYEFRYRRADGSYAHVIDRGFIFYDEDGKPMREVGAMIDITDRVILSEAQAQAALEERQRLARELHDSVTQSIYSLTLLAEASRRTAQSGDVNKVVDNIARLGETAQQALKEMRLLVYELRPLALEQAGLADALQHRLDAVEKRAGVDARLRVNLTADLPPAAENGLYRIAQEALNNSLKHAEATTISVSLRTQEGRVELEIADNGKGFDSEAIHDQGGLGMISIRERVAALGGEYSIRSKPGEGTRVWIRAPLNPSA